MTSSIRTAFFAGLAALVVSSRSAQDEEDSPELMRVGIERAPLAALEQAEGSPLLGELLPGTALRVLERRGARVRVVVEGWIDAAALAELPVEAAPAGPESAPPAAPPPPPPRPVHDLALAQHVGVAAEVRGTGDERELVLALELRTIRKEPVLVEGAHHAGRVRVYEQQRVAGGRARGPELLAREVAWEGGRASLVVPFADFGAKLPAVALVSASIELSAKRTLHGAATDVALAARPPAR